MLQASNKTVSADIISSRLADAIKEYYDVAGPDYASWSPGLNMHFGYWRPGLNPLNRESLLEEMTLQTLRRLASNRTAPASVVDLGCGYGASMRTGWKRYPATDFHGVTIVDSQIKLAREWALSLGASKKLSYSNDDFENLSLLENSFDAAYAIESVAHANHPGRECFLKQLKKILKPGGRFVITDVFLERPREEMPRYLRNAYQQLCDGWAVKDMPHRIPFVQTLEELGFSNIKVEDISWNVAPCCIYPPFVVLKFLIAKVVSGEKLKREQIGNLKASLVSSFVAAHRKFFSYLMISGNS